jgi:hypothetical protein
MALVLYAYYIINIISASDSLLEFATHGLKTIGLKIVIVIKWQLIMGLNSILLCGPPFSTLDAKCDVGPTGQASGGSLRTERSPGSNAGTPEVVG